MKTDFPDQDPITPLCFLHTLSLPPCHLAKAKQKSSTSFKGPPGLGSSYLMSPEQRTCIYLGSNDPVLELMV